MDIWAWTIAACVSVLLLAGFLLLTPARSVIDINTAIGRANVHIKSVWGRGPAFRYGSEGRTRRGPFSKFVGRLRNVPRLTHAAMAAPKAFPALKRFLGRLKRMHPQRNKVALNVNLADPRLNLAIDLASLVPGLPIAVSKRDEPGLDVRATFHVTVSPLRLIGAYLLFRNAAPVREVLRRLRRP